ncbi:MAG: serine/threonine protein kinase, partial [Candidatus Hydrogenedentes bacterium]|nr:serine/threonine protein kinase [Candidatus Hydrogenedentota bacterium]
MDKRDEQLHPAPLQEATTIAGESQPGSARLATRSTLLRVAGQGGMATVYEAWDERLSRTVAVKCLQPRLRQDATILRRFWAEADVLGSMDHPGMPQVYDRGEHPESGPFYVMKFVRGQTLATRLKWRTPSDFKARGDLDIYLGIFQKVCEAMGYAHGRHVVHRDLKPANIMIGDHGEVLIMDWGIAKRLTGTSDVATGIGQVLGTPAHMSPEQASGRSHEIDPRSDVFSLGIMLYNILTLQLPFTGTSTAELKDQIINLHPTSPRSLQRTIAPALSGICMKALSKAPADRYATARDLAEDIQLFRASRPTAGYAMGFRDRAKAWCLRHPAVSAVALVLSVLILSVGGMEWRSRHNRALEQQRVTAAAMAYMDAVQPAIDDLETRYSAIAVQLADGAALDASARAALESESETLKVAREALLDYNREVIAYTLGRYVDPLAPGAADVDPALLARVREGELARIQALMRTGQLHKADFDIHDARERDFLYGWSQQQKSELDRLQETVRGGMLAERGAPAPDWDAHDPR